MLNPGKKYTKDWFDFMKREIEIVPILQIAETIFL